MGFFEAGAKRSPLHKISDTYPTIMKLSTLISYVNDIQKIHESPDTPLGLC